MKRMKYFGAAALLTLLAACSNDDMENASYQDDPLAVRITATAGKNVITRSYPTDDTNQSAFKDGDRISVGTDDQDAIIYTKKSTGWEPESGYLKWTSSPLTFNAYYPVDENNASMTTFNVPTPQNSLDAIEKADYMTYSGTQSKPATASGSITLTLERKMARVVIGKIEFLDQYANGYKVTSITVHGNTSGYADGNPKIGNIDVETYQADGKFYALLSPTTKDDAAIFLTVTVKADNAPDTEQGTELKVKGIPALAASNSYTYTLTVGKDMIAVSSVTVKEWNDGGSVIENGGEGEAEEKTEGANASTHTITTSTVGQINSNSDWIATAISGGTSLKIIGPMNDDDIEALKTYLVDNRKAALELDLSKVTELTAFPNYGFSEYDGTTTLGLKSIILPDVMTKIGANAFNGYCTELESVTLPAGLKEIEGAAFFGCSKLSNIKVAGRATNELPEGLTTLEDGAFSGTILETITIPASLTTTTSWTLNGMTSLKTVYWNSSAETPFECFGNCTSLTDIYFTSETAPAVGNNLFGLLKQAITIHIPAAYEANYSAWKALETNTSDWNITCVTE